MDELDKFVEDNGLTFENVLKYIDCYSIYSFYIGQELEVGEKYSSPLRPGDADPSFALYFSNTGSEDLLFKDHALGLWGNALQFVKELLQLSYQDTLLQINSDFQLDFSNVKSEFKPKIIKRSYKKLVKEPMEIRITKKDTFSPAFKHYWFELLDINESTLKTFYTTEPFMVHYVRPTRETVAKPKSMCVAYEINGYYKIYQPFDKKEFKFRNNYPYGYVEGGLQLRWNKPFCILTKSTKEIIFFREHFDWDSFAGTSENNIINSLFLEKVFAAYPTVFIWLDNDIPGKRAQAKYLEKYPQLIPIDPSNEFNAKDPTDMYMYNQDKKAEVLKFINETINTNLPNAAKEN